MFAEILVLQGKIHPQKEKKIPSADSLTLVILV